MSERRRPDPGSRPDPYELAVARAADEPGPDEDGPPPLPRLQIGPFAVTPLRLLLLVVLVVGAGGLVRFDANRAPTLPPSCTTPGLALSRERVQPGGLLQYAVVGPDAARAVLAVDVRDLRDVPAGAQVLPAFAVRDCGAQGRFGVQVAPGEHTVALFDAASPGTPLVTRPLTVTELGDPSGA